VIRRRLLLGVIMAGACLIRVGPVKGQEAVPARVGTVTGTALAIGPRAASPPVPLAALEVLLLPRSDAVLASLERIKRQSRDSMSGYRTAIPEMRQILETFVRDLRGSGDLLVIPRATVDDTGRFAISDVAAGRWILLGRRSAYVDRASKDTRKETGIYQAQPRLVGYERVTVWLQEVTVEPGVDPGVELTDRNVWFEGVEEKTASRDRSGVRPSRRSDH
jgi:hypothetical protein